MIDRKIFLLLSREILNFLDATRKTPRYLQVLTQRRWSQSFVLYNHCQRVDHNEYKQIYLRLAPYLEKQVRLQQVAIVSSVHQ